MRGYGSMGSLGLLSALGMAMEAGNFDEVRYDRMGFAHRGRAGHGTGWKDKRFRHPEGPCDYRPIGSKRSRRRNSKK